MRRVHITGAKVFDGEAFHEDLSISFDSAGITALGRDIPRAADDQVIDGSGCTVLPGLIDAHVHVPSMIQYAEKHLKLATRFGVTFLVDFGSDPETISHVRNRARSSPAFPSAVSAGVLATAPGGHPLELGGPLPTVSNQTRVTDFVRERVREGSDFFKIILEDGATYGIVSPFLERQTYSALVRAAHDEGLLVATHAPALQFATWAVEEGTDILAHAVVDAPPDEELIAAMVEAGIVMIPTLAVFESAAANPQINDDRIVSVLDADSLDRLSEAVDPVHRPSSQIGHAKEWASAYEAAGGVVLAGTDAPNPGTMTGVSLHRELQLLVESGLSPSAALASATSRVADTFRLTGRGRLAAEYIADLLMVAGDVEQDITNTINTIRVWRSGVPVGERRNDLSAPF